MTSNNDTKGITMRQTVSQGRYADLASTLYASTDLGAQSMLLAVLVRNHVDDAREVFDGRGECLCLPIQGTTQYAAFGEDGSEWIVDLGDELGRGRYVHNVFNGEADRDVVHQVPNYQPRV